MRYETKRLRLKNGQEAVFRSPEAADAEKMLAHIAGCAQETDFLLREPEECTGTAEEEARQLEALRRSENELMILCEVAGEIAGICRITFGIFSRIRHRGTIVLSLRQKYWGIGIGTALFEEMTAMARKRGATQLELGHMEGNTRAHRLYEKMGFAAVAEHPDAFRMKDGTLRKEIWMVKKL